MSDVVAELDRLIESLDQAPAAGTSATSAALPAGGDAIDAVLAGPPRKTAVRSLRNDPVLEAFRQELVDGLIRVDTLNRLLGLVNTVVTALLAR